MKRLKIYSERGGSTSPEWWVNINRNGGSTWSGIYKIAKIGGYATYHKCIKDLQAYGYIQYLPSYHPALGSLVYLNIFERNSRKQ